MKRTMRTLCATVVAVAALNDPAAAQPGYAQSVVATDQEVMVGQSLSAAEPGYVFVYRPDGSGGWSEVARLQASDAEPNDHFGRALAFARGDLLVGATIARQSGALYVFERGPDGTWREAASMVPTDADSSHSFGRVAATDGETVAMADWAARQSRGAVYVFEKGDTGWRETASLTAPDAQPNGWFGYSIAVAGDRIAVGKLNPNDQTDRGVVDIFQRQGGTWTHTARVETNDTSGNPRFGAAVALSGDALIVGTPGADGFVGAIHTYRGNEAGAEWTHTGRITPPAGTPPNGAFPNVLETVGDDVWIGAPAFDTGMVLRLTPGAGGTWSIAGTLPADSTDSGDGLGGSFSMRGDLAVAGAVGDDFGMGSAIVYRRSGGQWSVVDRLFTKATAYDAITGGRVDCSGGKAAVFDCEGLDVLSFLPVTEIGGSRGIEVNDVWGWVDPQTGSEWAIVGRYDGTSFIDLSDPANPRYAGNLPLHEGAQPNIWRDIKVYRDHAYIVADGAGQHGMQVFDLTRLRDIAPGADPATFTEDAHYDRIASAHNIVINEETGFAYAVGASSGGETCGGGLHMIDIREPKAPAFAGCFQDTETGNQRTGYSHDAQCVVYHGPDEQYRGREICFGSNETALSIADVTAKDSTIALSRAAYPNVGYAHQGWLDEEHEFFYMNDEGDETSGTVQNTRTLVWDVRDLGDPVLALEYFGTSTSSDHNLYIVGDYMYQSNYVSGLRLVDISNRSAPREVGFFDTVPGNDAPGFDGSWSNYPFFPSGTIVVTSGREGVFFLQRKPRTIS